MHLTKTEMMHGSRAATRPCTGEFDMTVKMVVGHKAAEARVLCRSDPMSRGYEMNVMMVVKGELAEATVVHRAPRRYDPMSRRAGLGTGTPHWLDFENLRRAMCN